MKGLLVLSAMLMVSWGAPAQAGTSRSKLWDRIEFVRLTGIEPIIQRVRLLDRMTYRMGFAPVPGEFYRLSQAALREGTLEDFRRLLTDVSPLVRVMGLVCLAASLDDVELAAASALLERDGAVITYMDGCMDQTATVAEIARKIVAGRFRVGGKARVHLLNGNDQWARA